MLLGVVDAIGDLRATDVRHLLELRTELLEAVLRQVGGLVVHDRSPLKRGRAQGHDRVVGQLITKRTSGAPRVHRAPEGPSRTRMVVGSPVGVKSPRRASDGPLSRPQRGGTTGA